MYRWLSKHHEFRKEVYAAEEAGAFYFRDKYRDTVENLADEDDVQVAKVKLQGYEKLASWANPQKFGHKKIIEGSEDKPVRIIFDTGITREMPEELEKKSEKEVESEVK